MPTYYQQNLPFQFMNIAEETPMHAHSSPSLLQPDSGNGYLSLQQLPGV